MAIWGMAKTHILQAQDEKMRTLGLVGSWVGFPGEPLVVPLRAEGTSWNYVPIMLENQNLRHAKST